MKKTMRKLIMSVMLLFAALCGAAGATFAWFTAGDSAGRVNVSVAAIGVHVAVLDGDTTVYSAFVRSETNEASFTAEVGSGEHTVVLSNFNAAPVTVTADGEDYELPADHQIEIEVSGEIKIEFKA